MSITDFHALYTLTSLIVFVGICIWAFSRKRDKYFNEASRLPFADDALADQSAAKTSTENK